MYYDHSGITEFPSTEYWFHSVLTEQRIRKLNYSHQPLKQKQKQNNKNRKKTNTTTPPPPQKKRKKRENIPKPPTHPPTHTLAHMLQVMTLCWTASVFVAKIDELL